MTLSDRASTYEFWVESRIQSTKVDGLERAKKPSRKNALGWGEDIPVSALCQVEGSIGLNAWRERGLPHACFLAQRFACWSQKSPVACGCQKTAVPRSRQGCWNAKDGRVTEGTVGVLYS